jgi:8-oxo-dGTP diphosphatase
MNRRNLRFAILAVDAAVVAVVNRVPRVLLMQVRGPSAVARALPGGLIRPDETAEQAVARHLSEKCGLKSLYSEQLATFSRVDRDPSGRVVSVAYLALMPARLALQHRLPDGLSWCEAEKVGRLAYDHNDVVVAAMNHLRTKLQSTTVARHLIAPYFTLSELQGVYEGALGRALDKRNFRKKIIAGDIVQATGKMQRSASGRPSEFYRFTGTKVEVIDILSRA